MAEKQTGESYSLNKRLAAGPIRGQAVEMDIYEERVQRYGLSPDDRHI
jgi:hypothetical protein